MATSQATNINCIFKPNSNEELQSAVNLWCKDRDNAILEYGYISTWDTNKINNMIGLFYDKTDFNDDISLWDVSNVTDMESMFKDAKCFNQSISNWNVGNVKDMESMFCNAKSFDQPLNNWNVSNVVNMSYMFRLATSFNQPLNNWDISNVRYMNGMFANTIFYNESVKNWNLSKVYKIHINKNNNVSNEYANKVISHRFIKGNDVNIIKNNPILSLPTDLILNILKYTTIKELLLFSDLSIDDPNNIIWEKFAIKNNISPPKKKGRKYKTWKDVVLKNKKQICFNCFDYYGSELISVKFLNIYVCQNCFKLEKFKMVPLFEEINRFKPRCKKDLQDAIDLFFKDKIIAIYRYGHISRWNTKYITDMSELFMNKKKFNEDISLWNVSSVTDMNKMFYKSESFNQSIEKWDVSSVTDMSYMFCNAISFNKPLNNWNISKVKNVNAMFYHAKLFNQSLDNWDVSKVINMSGMFYHAKSFNQNINDWNVLNVNNMMNMFREAYSFNQPLNNWDVRNVKDMSSMFSYAKELNQPLDKWDISGFADIKNIFCGSNSFRIKKTGNLIKIINV